MADPVRETFSSLQSMLLTGTFDIGTGVSRVSGPHSRQYHELVSGSVDIVHSGALEVAVQIVSRYGVDSQSVGLRRMRRLKQTAFQ
jgi:hypothetical protein